MSAVPSTCSAVILSDFGDTSMLTLAEIPTPALSRPDSMLVRVKATGVNPIEWKMREGLGPIRLLGRQVLGNPMILGLDFSGVVAAVGPAVTGFKVGDEVFGTVPNGGTYAEYVVVRPADSRTAVARKPASLSHNIAGAAPFAGLVAYAGLVTYGGLQVRRTTASTGPGPRVFIIGASGGVGHLAVQMAKRCLGASYVVGVSSSRNAEFARRCGADEVVAHDNIQVDAIAGQHPDWMHSFDLIFDTIGVDSYYTTLAPQLLKRGTGRFVTAALPPSRPGKAGEDVGLLDGLSLAARLGWRRLTGRYSLITGLLGGLPTKDGFQDIVRWMDEGKLGVEVWKQFDLAHMREAHEASQTGRAVGKIAIEVP